MMMERKLFLILLNFIALTFADLSLAKENAIDEITVESLNADYVTNDIDGNLILEGNVYIKTNLLDFYSDKALFNQTDGLLELVGKVKVESPSLLINSSQISANLNLKSFSLEQADIKINDSSFGSASEFVIKTSGDIELINSSITNCSKENPSWEISLRSIEFFKENQNAVIKGIKLKIKNLPVFYFPFLRTAVTNKKMTGFLTPGLSQSNYGLDLSLPYYFNLAQNYDLTLTPRHITSRGSGIASNFRYLHSKSKGEIKLSNIFSDSRYKNETGKDNSRWSVSWINETSMGDNWFSSINFQSTSDEYFFRDIGNHQFGETRKSYLPKRFALTWKNNFMKIDLDIKRYQLLNPFSFDEYKIIPSFNFESYLNRGDLSFSLIANKTKFELEEPRSIGNFYQKINRYFVVPELNLTKNLRSSQLVIGLGSTYTNHNSSYKRTEESYPWVEIKYNLLLDKFKENSFSSLSPTIKYIFVEGDHLIQNFLVDSRRMSLDYKTMFQRSNFVGVDRILKTNKMVLGLEKISWEEKNNRYRSFAVGQAFYLDDQKNDLSPLFRKNKSPLIAEFQSQLKSNIWSKGVVEWEEASNKINLVTLGFIYKKSNQKRIEVKSIYRRSNKDSQLMPWLDLESPTNNLEILGQWPLSNKFHLFGRLQKDLDINKSKDILFGFEYSNCCLKWGLMKRKWTEPDYFSWRNNFSSSVEALSSGLNPSFERNKVYLFFELKDIGRFGKEISRALSSTKLE